MTINHGAHTKTPAFQALLLDWAEKDAILGFFDRAKAHLERRTEPTNFDQFMLGVVVRQARAGNLETAAKLASAIEVEDLRVIANRLIRVFDDALARLAKEFIEDREVARLIVTQIADEERRQRGLEWIDK